MIPGTQLFTQLDDYPRLKVVGSFEELVMTPMRDGINALCWPRALPGDYGEIVEKLGVGKGITSLDEERLLPLELSDAGRVAREILLQDLELLRALSDVSHPCSSASIRGSLNRFGRSSRGVGSPVLLIIAIALELKNS